MVGERTAAPRGRRGQNRRSAPTSDSPDFPVESVSTSTRCCKARSRRPRQQVRHPFHPQWQRDRDRLPSPDSRTRHSAPRLGRAERLTSVPTGRVQRSQRVRTPVTAPPAGSDARIRQRPRLLLRLEPMLDRRDALHHLRGRGRRRECRSFHDAPAEPLGKHPLELGERLRRSRSRSGDRSRASGRGPAPRRPRGANGGRRGPRRAAAVGPARDRPVRAVPARRRRRPGARRSGPPRPGTGAHATGPPARRKTSVGSRTGLRARAGTSRRDDARSASGRLVRTSAQSDAPLLEKSATPRAGPRSELFLRYSSIRPASHTTLLRSARSSQTPAHPADARARRTATDLRLARQRRRRCPGTGC
jgi:hypothetical protein